MQLIKKNTISRINNGDTKAFEELYSAFYVYLCAVATKYVYSPENAQEIVNDVFISVWDNRESLLYPVNAYLVRAVRNRSLNYLRQQRQREIPLSEVEEELLAIQEQQVIGSDSHPLAYLENKEFENSIYQAVNTLPPKCKDVFVQYLYYNRSYEEIALANNISSSTVRVQIKIGLSKLRLLLGDFYPLFVIIFSFPEK